MTVVYTSILGGSDSLKPAPKGADKCVCFVDNPRAYPDDNGWDLVRREYSSDPRREAWIVRCHAHQFFPGFTTVWIDASFTLTDLPRLLKDAGKAPVSALRHHRRSSYMTEARELVNVGSARREDVERQIRDYEKAGFVAPHLSISCIVVRDRSEQARRFGETWADQIATYPGDNTQLSLDYSAWVNGFQIHGLRGSRHHNPYAMHDANDHKRRRKPYQLPGAAA